MGYGTVATPLQLGTFHLPSHSLHTIQLLAHDTVLNFLQQKNCLPGGQSWFAEIGSSTEVMPHHLHLHSGPVLSQQPDYSWENLPSLQIVPMLPMLSPILQASP